MCPNMASRTEDTQNNKNLETKIPVQESSSLDILTCSAVTLASYLNQRRFNGDIAMSMAFLQEAHGALENQDTMSSGRTKSTDNTLATHNFGRPLLPQPLETSLINPRGGKCSVQLYDNGYLVATQVKDPSVLLVIPPEAVSHLVLFAKPEDYKSIVANKKAPGAHMVLLKLQSDKIIFQGKPVKEQVCFPLSWTKGLGPTGPSGETGWIDASAAWRQVLEKCLGHPKLTTCQVEPQRGKGPFLSYQEPSLSSTTGGVPFVTCYHGVQDGVLYPMREGLLFYKPPKFLPRSNLVSIACGRGNGGQSSSRYVDMIVQVDKDDTQEFTNIQREELRVLNDYIHQVLIPAMQQDTKTSGSSSSSKPVSNTSEDDQVVDVEEADDEDDVELEEDSDGDENYAMSEEDDGGHEREEDDSENEDDDDDDESDDEDGVEVVDDDFAAELAKNNQGIRPNEPRASRSTKRKSMSAPEACRDVEDVVASEQAGDDDDDDDFEVNDDDFEVVVHAEEDSAESEGYDDESPNKRSRHSHMG